MRGGGSTWSGRGDCSRSRWPAPALSQASPMASLSEQVDEWLASCSSSSPLKVKREDDGGHAASSVTLMLEADGAEDGAPRPVVQVMLQAGRVTLMCVDEDDQYEGFNTAAAQVRVCVCVPGSGGHLCSSLRHQSQSPLTGRGCSRPAPLTVLCEGLHRSHGAGSHGGVVQCTRGAGSANG